MDVFEFLSVAVGVLLVPGPTVLVIVSTTLNHGRPRSLQTVLGACLALGICTMLTIPWVSWLYQSNAQLFVVVKWLGVVYLICLGVHSFSKWNNADQVLPSSKNAFKLGFFVSLSNPKIILFLLIYLPKYAQNSGASAIEMVYLAILFPVLALPLYTGISLAANCLRKVASSQYYYQIQSGISATVYLGAGTLLASTHYV